MVLRSQPLLAADNPRGERYAYDLLDRLTRLTHADGSYRSISYGSQGLRQTRNERNHTTTEHFQAFADPHSARVWRRVAPEGVVTEWSRDALGTVKGIRFHP